MAFKMQERDTKNKLVSMFKNSNSKSEDQHSEGEAMKQKVSRLFSKIGQCFQKVQFSECSCSPSFPELSQKPETQVSSPKEGRCLKQDELWSNEVMELSPKINELPQQAGEMSPNMAVLSPSPDELSPGITKFSPKRNELSPKKEKFFRKKTRNVEPEIFIFPTVPELLEAEHRRETRKPRRFQSETGQSTNRNIKDQHRQRVLSEPCINKYAELIASRGIQLTEAANKLTEEECRLLYEDIFKPLDIYSILQERNMHGCLQMN